LKNTRFLLFTLLLGLGTLVIAISVSERAIVKFADGPSAVLWLGLAVVVTVLPVGGVAGVRSLNISPLPLLTMLLLYGTGPALLAGWLCGIAATLSSRRGGAKGDLQRALFNSGKHGLCILAAGVVLWGRGLETGCLETGLSLGVFLRLIVAHAVYLVVSTQLLAFALRLRDGRSPLEVWQGNFGWGALVSWSTPLGAFLLAIFYMNGGFLLIGILIGIGLIGIVTVRDHVRIKSSFVQLVDGLRMARDGNMPHLKGETQHVVDLAVALGHKMRLPYKSLELLEHAAMLHNVGYIAVDRDTVLKPALLTDAEMSEIREHPESGMRILREVVGMEGVADIVLCHHESPDGTGYPQGLKGNKIPMEAAIIKVAEAFVAMTNSRPHRSKPFSKNEALDEIARDAGHALDATVTYFLFELMGRSDLSAGVAKGFGPPSKQHIRSRLYKSPARPFALFPHRWKEKQSMLIGSCIVGVAAAIILVFGKLGVPLTLGLRSGLVTSTALGSLFFLFLLGLAALRPVRLPRGAYVSSASAVVLAISLAGGPVYAVIFGFALIGWAMLLDPANALSKSQAAVNGVLSGANGNGCENGDRHPNGNGDGRANGNVDAHRNGYAHWNGHAGTGYGNGHGHGFQKVPGKSAARHNRGITYIIKSKALESQLSTASAYGFLLMLAGSGSWVAYEAGRRASQILGLHGTASDLIPFALSVGAFYFVETMLQSALLSGHGLSAGRIWQRNYLKILPEPLTYAVCGYAILMSTTLLGFWAAIPLFLFPTLWRHLALLRRLELMKTKESLIRSIARAVDEKDRYTGGHSASVVEIATAIAREMGKSELFVEQLEEAAIRHDLGKVSWPHQVLRKPALLNEQEEEEYKWTHPDVSAAIAARVGSSDQVIEMIKYHHERQDGKGYPHKLTGDKIPLGSRILCVADSFDAMVHDRWYRRKRTLQDAIDEVSRCSGTQFDPAIVDAFLSVLEKIDLERLIEAVELGVGEITEEVEVEAKI
jgi:HD-GYP domain-containing protein (c-di-GMP phosphodiesterase class II)